jgi:hypothetical protein
VIVLLGGHFHYDEVVAENAHSFFRRLTSLCDLGDSRVAFADRGEDFEFESGLQSLSALVRIDCLEEYLG